MLRVVASPRSRLQTQFNSGVSESCNLEVRTSGIRHRSLNKRRPRHRQASSLSLLIGRVWRLWTGALLGNQLLRRRCVGRWGLLRPAPPLGSSPGTPNRACCSVWLSALAASQDLMQELLRSSASARHGNLRVQRLFKRCTISLQPWK